MLYYLKQYPATIFKSHCDLVHQFRDRMQLSSLLGPVCDAVLDAGVAVSFWFGYLLPLVKEAIR